MNKIILIIVAAIVIFGAFTFLGNKKTTPTTQPAAQQATQSTTKPTVIETNSSITTIALTNAGFTPKDVIVKAGAKVVWENKSGSAATVNSASHPTHLLYPFLNLGEFADGSSVQVVFEKAGKYSYHNHLNPSETGTITVE